MKELLGHVLNKISTGIIVLDHNLNIILWNHWLQKFTGIKSTECLGCHISQVVPRFSQTTYHNMLVMALQKGQSRFCSSTLHKAFVHPAEIPMENFKGKQNVQIEPINIDNCRYVLIQITDMTSHHAQVLQLKNAILTMEAEFTEIKSFDTLSQIYCPMDYLTQLPNREFLYKKASSLLRSFKRTGQGFAVLFLDLDSFKSVNDNFGHEAGDILLKEAASRLRQTLRKNDVLVRYGGDEFIVLLPQVKNEKEPEYVAQKLLDAFIRPFTLAQQNIAISISIGICTCPLHGENCEVLIKNADTAMYAAKASGKNTFRFFNT